MGWADTLPRYTLTPQTLVWGGSLSLDLLRKTKALSPVPVIPYPISYNNGNVSVGYRIRDLVADGLYVALDEISVPNR